MNIENFQFDYFEIKEKIYNLKIARLNYRNNAKIKSK